MFRGRIVARILLAVLLVAVIVGGGMVAYRAGWAQGYQTGTVISSSEGTESGLLVPQFGSHMYRPFYPGFGFPFFGLCLGIGFIFLILFMVGGLLKPWGQRHRAGYPHHGKWGHGPMPPWAKEWEQYKQKMTEDEESGEDSGDEQESEDKGT